jgi:hypothetical protein
VIPQRQGFRQGDGLTDVTAAIEFGFAGHWKLAKSHVVRLGCAIFELQNNARFELGKLSRELRREFARAAILADDQTRRNQSRPLFAKSLFQGAIQRFFGVHADA